MTKRFSVSVALVLCAVTGFFSMSVPVDAITVRTRTQTSSSRPLVAVPKPVPVKARVAVLRKTKVAAVLPRRLEIPRLKIAAPVLDVGLLPAGRMDVPPDGEKVGWYTPGAKPGQIGNAVIAGHLTTAKGPGAFWELNKTKVGDTIHVYDDNGNKREFRVKKTALYDARNAPVKEIFGSSTTPNLNLITCAGVWDRTLNHYDKRFVVYAELVNKGVTVVRR